MIFALNLSPHLFLIRIPGLGIAFDGAVSGDIGKILALYVCGWQFSVYIRRWTNWKDLTEHQRKKWLSVIDHGSERGSWNRSFFIHCLEIEAAYHKHDGDFDANYFTC